MPFELTDEQTMIQTMVRDFAREVLLPTAAECATRPRNFQPKIFEGWENWASWA